MNEEAINSNYHNKNDDVYFIELTTWQWITKPTLNMSYLNYTDSANSANV